MRGEMYWWFRLASHLHLPVWECRKRVPSSEFECWKVYLEKKEEEVSKLDYYLAGIWSEIVRTHVKNPERIHWKQFLPVWKPTAVKQDVKKSKKLWLQIFGIKEKDKK